MLDGMEHIKCCGNCVKYDTVKKICLIGNKIGLDFPYFYLCKEFEKSNINISLAKDLIGDGVSYDELPNKPTEVPMLYLDKDKLIYNMAKYIAKLDIDSDICTPMKNEGGCLIENECNSISECGLDICIECVKNWFSEDREESD